MNDTYIKIIVNNRKYIGKTRENPTVCAKNTEGFIPSILSKLCQQPRRMRFF